MVKQSKPNVKLLFGGNIKVNAYKKKKENAEKYRKLENLRL